MSFAHNWGCTDAERASAYPCDGLLSPTDAALFRLDHLERGQEVMSIFRLADYEEGRHLTLIMHKPWALRRFGTVAGSYVVVPVSERSCRLLVKLLVRYPRGAYGVFLGAVLPVGDLLMMRKQLVTLKKLSEQASARHAS